MTTATRERSLLYPQFQSYPLHGEVLMLLDRRFLKGVSHVLLKWRLSDDNRIITVGSMNSRMYPIEHDKIDEFLSWFDGAVWRNSIGCIGQ